MFRTFNMGIGLIAICSAGDAETSSVVGAERRAACTARSGDLRRPRRSLRVTALDRRIAVLISGRGSNLQSIIDAIADRRLDATIAVVISNRRDAPGLQRAHAAGIETMCISSKDHPNRDASDRAIVGALQARSVGLVCLAGYMRIVGRPILDVFKHRILNIHPSLLPSFPALMRNVRRFIRMSPAPPFIS
jgi:formyltetrahydrofolate hydrolase